jgi:hypothetical protein
MCRFFILRHWRRIIYSRKQEGSGAFGARVQAAMGLTPLAAPVPPAERAGSEGSVLCCLRQRPLLVAGATTFAPKGETTHYILRVADASSKCVRCAPLWEACHWILSRPRAPCESSSLATPLKRWNCGYWAVASIWVYGSRGEKTIQPGFARENKQTGLRPGKQANRASPAEMHPFWC